MILAYAVGDLVCEWKPPFFPRACYLFKTRELVDREQTQSRLLHLDFLHSLTSVGLMYIEQIDKTEQ